MYMRMNAQAQTGKMIMTVKQRLDDNKWEVRNKIKIRGGGTRSEQSQLQYKCVEVWQSGARRKEKVCESMEGKKYFSMVN